MYILRRLSILPIRLFGLSVLVFSMLQSLDPVERAALYVSSPPRTPGAWAGGGLCRLGAVGQFCAQLDT